MPVEVMPELDQLLVDLRASSVNSNVISYVEIKEALKNISLNWDFGGRGKLKAAAIAGGEAAAKFGAGQGVSKAFSVSAVAGGLVASAAVMVAGSFAPVLAAWIGAAQVAHSAYTSFSLWDLVPRSKGGQGLYTCTCGKCDDIAYYLAERHDIGVAKFGASLFIVPLLYTVPEKLFNMKSSGLSSRKLKMAHDLWQNARPESFPMIQGETYQLPTKPKGNKVADLYEVTKIAPPGQLPIKPKGNKVADLHDVAKIALPGKGFIDPREPRPISAAEVNPEYVPAPVIAGGCRKAQAIIATLCKEHSADRTKYSKTLATILSADGVKALASKIYD
jgi:hypothetical protein